MNNQELWQNGIIPKFKPGPGPCLYKLPDQLSKVSYTIGTRTPINSKQLLYLIMFIDKLTFLESPGPGAYPPISTITCNGKYFLSKFAGSKTSLFNPPRSTRFTNFSTSFVLYWIISSKAKDNPGPGTY